jgi:hypothetical protein
MGSWRRGMGGVCECASSAVLVILGRSMLNHTVGRYQDNYNKPKFDLFKCGAALKILR